MGSTELSSGNKFRLGLFLQIGNKSWLWGRPPVTAPKSEDPPVAPSDPEVWSSLAAWLRWMHSRADHMPTDSGSTSTPEASRPRHRSSPVTTRASDAESVIRVPSPRVVRVEVG